MKKNQDELGSMGDLKDINRIYNPKILRVLKQPRYDNLISYDPNYVLVTGLTDDELNEV